MHFFVHWTISFQCIEGLPSLYSPLYSATCTKHAAETCMKFLLKTISTSCFSAEKAIPSKSLRDGYFLLNCTYFWRRTGDFIPRSLEDHQVKFGERICLARSISVEKGTRLEVEVNVKLPALDSLPLLLRLVLLVTCEAADSIMLEKMKSFSSNCLRQPGTNI